MAGINISGNDVREFPEKVVEILKPTRIRWVRVHVLPTRSLDQKGPTGLSYLEGIDHLCKNGYNILAPIEVGYTKNVGDVPMEGLDSFVEDSYYRSFQASKMIAEVAQRSGVQLMFGIENEIDVKSWILQSLPGVGWRSRFESWTRLAIDFDLKYKRLNNILRGVKDAAPSVKTMTNIVAEDLRVFFGDFRREFAKHSNLLKQHSVSIDEVPDDLIDWKVELGYLKNNLNVDYVGLDTYANWILKYPVYGQETGGKVGEAAGISGKPVFNPEFGYTTHRSFFEKMLFTLLRRQSASRMQLQFYENTLSSIAKSDSMGAFPWVLITHTDRKAVPRQEAFFGLFKMRHGKLRKEPAFDYYVEWLSKTHPAS